jgi:hypothetical protein
MSKLVRGLFGPASETREPGNDLTFLEVEHKQI